MNWINYGKEVFYVDGYEMQNGVGIGKDVKDVVNVF